MKPFFLLLGLCVHLISHADVETTYAGEQGMIKAMRAAIDKSTDLKGHVINLGAGVSGAKAFQTPAADSTTNVLMTWQWLDDMSSLAEGTVVVMPKHAIDDNFKPITKKVRLIEIEGVLHTKTRASIENEKTDGIKKETQLIVMLPGDTQQSDGSWKMYTPEMAQAFLKDLPADQKILFLNGPRTGKYKIVTDKDTGTLAEDATAHRTTTDAVTQFILDQKNPHWEVVDFKYGSLSLWGPALKFLLENPGTSLVLPGESTSMISEALGLGIHPSILKHPVMTGTSVEYVDDLINQGKATLYPTFPEEGKRLGDPVEPQENVVIRELTKLFGEKK